MARPRQIEQLLERQARSWEVRRKLAGEGGEAARRALVHLQEGPWVSVSRQWGSGGRQMAVELGSRLGWQVYDREILTEMAQQAHLRAAILSRVEKRSLDTFGEYIAHLVTGDPVRPAYAQEMMQVVWGLARQGQRVYQDLGCATCHTQQVRRKNFGADIDRGWGSRQSVSRDYIHQSRVMIGSMRIGPDLMNIGDRHPTADWHHHHLYNPQINTPSTTMPPHACLYEMRKVMGTSSPNRVPLSGVHAPPDGFEVVPTSRANALVAYLLSLKTPYDLPEAGSSHE